MPPGLTKYTRTCVVCGKIMEGVGARRKKCSPECIEVFRQEYDKRHYSLNRDKELDYAKRVRSTEEGKRRHRESAKRYYWLNPEKFIQRQKDNRKKNPELYRLRSRVSSLKIRCKRVRPTVAVLQRVYEDNIKKNGTLTCYLCKSPISFGDDAIDHIIPIVRGGDNSLDNLSVTHRRCNSKKQCKTPEEYYEWLRLNEKEA